MCFKFGACGHCHGTAWPVVKSVWVDLSPMTLAGLAVDQATALGIEVPHDARIASAAIRVARRIELCLYCAVGVSEARIADAEQSPLIDDKIERWCSATEDERTEWRRARRQWEEREFS